MADYLKPASGILSPKVVADRIKAERERLGYTITGTADRLGVARESYQQLEHNANPRLSKLLELAQLGFDVRAIAPELFSALPTSPNGHTLEESTTSILREGEAVATATKPKAGAKAKPAASKAKPEAKARDTPAPRAAVPSGVGAHGKQAAPATTARSGTKAAAKAGARKTR